MAAEEEADPVEPSTVPAWFREMVTDHRAGPFHQSELLYRQSLTTDPWNAETWHLLGLIVHQAGHPEQGIAHLRQALALSPGNASYLHSLGSIYQEIGHYEQALPCFREVLRRDPTQLPAAQGLGMALKQVGRFDEALDVFRAKPRSRSFATDRSQRPGRSLSTTRPLPRGLNSLPPCFTHLAPLWPRAITIICGSSTTSPIGMRTPPSMNIGSGV